LIFLMRENRKIMWLEQPTEFTQSKKKKKKITAEHSDQAESALLCEMIHQVLSTSRQETHVFHRLDGRILHPWTHDPSDRRSWCTWFPCGPYPGFAAPTQCTTHRSTKTTLISLRLQDPTCFSLFFFWSLALNLRLRGDWPLLEKHQRTLQKRMRD
jgi:hypothetical protein